MEVLPHFSPTHTQQEAVKHNKAKVVNYRQEYNLVGKKWGIAYHLMEKSTKFTREKGNKALGIRIPRAAFLVQNQGEYSWDL